MVLITFANSLDPDQDGHGSKLFDTMIVFLKEFFGEKNLEKKLADNNKSMKTSHKSYHSVVNFHFLTINPSANHNKICLFCRLPKCFKNKGCVG